MNTYTITNKVTNYLFGTYQGNNELEALEAFAIESGYDSFADCCGVALMSIEDFLVVLSD